MEAAAAGYPTDRGVLKPQPLDSQASTYTERPIRPLPKGRIGARLSSEDQDKIRRPPAIPSPSPPYNPSHSQVEHNYDQGSQYREVNASQEPADEICHRFVGQTLDSDEEVEERNSQPLRRPLHGGPESMYRYPRQRSDAPYRAAPPHSSGSSGDGYESFENTNNKKKRKVPGAVPLPTAGGSDGMAHSVSAPYTESRTGRSVSGGVSGAGRERIRGSGGRLSSERRPLATTTNNISPYPKGTISAAVDRQPSKGYTTAKGQENVSVLQRQKQPKSGSQSFTFECKSDSADKFAMAQPPPAPPAMSRAPAVPGGGKSKPAPGAVGNGSAPSAQYPASNHPSQQAPPPKPRRDPGWWKRAAERRRESKKNANYYTPPDPNNPDDNYFCVFCEYEQIFGHWPVSLGRSYEVKERRRRRERETNQKRLEAAKAKSRKGKKAKGGAKNSNAATSNTNPPNNQPYDPGYADPPPDDVSQDEALYDDDAYDEAMAAPAPLDTHGYQAPPPLPPGIDDLPSLDRSMSLPSRM